MGQPPLDLGQLFGAALQALTANRQEVNALDGHNGNHGDNMVENLQLITKALEAQKSQPPARALEYAGEQLAKKGRGGTSQYYAKGLAEAAELFQGQSELGNEDVMSLIQSLLGAIPSQGHPKQAKTGGTVLDQVMGLAGGQPSQPQPQDDELDLGGVLNVLVPAGLSFLQAKQSGADTKAAALQALGSALMGPQANPLQADTPRAAAGGLVAQGILQALTGRG